MDDIADILSTLASELEPEGWDLYRNQHVTRVKARTLDSFEDRAEAFAAASALLNVILELGYVARGAAEVGAIFEDSFNEWRGTIHVVLIPDADA